MIACATGAAPACAAVVARADRFERALEDVVLTRSPAARRASLEWGNSPGAGRGVCHLLPGGGAASVDEARGLSRRYPRSAATSASPHRRPRNPRRPPAPD